MRITQWDKKFLMVAVGLMVFFLVDVTPVVATQYYCQAISDICNVERSAVTQTVGCMNTSDSWLCHLTVGKGINCKASSKEKNPPISDWYSPEHMCNDLCNVCSGGWSQKQGSGSTY